MKILIERLNKALESNKLNDAQAKNYQAYIADISSNNMNAGVPEDIQDGMRNIYREAIVGK